MQFNVASLLQEPTGATREYDIDDDITIDGATRQRHGTRAVRPHAARRTGARGRCTARWTTCAAAA